MGSVAQRSNWLTTTATCVTRPGASGTICSLSSVAADVVSGPSDEATIQKVKIGTVVIVRE